MKKGDAAEHAEFHMKDNRWQHWVAKNDGFAVEGWSCDVFDMDVEMGFVGVFAIG